MATDDLKPLTAEEFAKVPDPLDARIELVNGRVVTMQLQFTVIGTYVSTIAIALHAFVREHKLGHTTARCGWILRRDPDTVRAPAAAFLSGSRVQGKLPDDAYFEGSPDLAVEVLSSDDFKTEFTGKVEEYLSAGATRVWIVDADREMLTVHRPGGIARTFDAEYTLTSDDAGFAVDGFELLVREIFT